MCIYTCTYIHTYYISATAICATGVTGLLNSALRLSGFRLFSVLRIIGTLLYLPEMTFSGNAPPPGRSLQTSFLQYVLANIAYFALWIHPTIRQTLTFCSTSVLKHSSSLCYKYVISENQLISQQFSKVKLLKNEKDSSQS